MKKSHKFDELSTTKICPCGRQIKKRFENNDNHPLCFDCYAKAQKAKGHVMKSNIKK